MKKIMLVVMLCLMIGGTVSCREVGRTDNTGGAGGILGVGKIFDNVWEFFEGGLNIFFKPNNTKKNVEETTVQDVTITKIEGEKIQYTNQGIPVNYAVLLFLIFIGIVIFQKIKNNKKIRQKQEDMALVFMQMIEVINNTSMKKLVKQKGNIDKNFAKIIEPLVKKVDFKINLGINRNVLETELKENNNEINVFRHRNNGG